MGVKKHKRQHIAFPTKMKILPSPTHPVLTNEALVTESWKYSNGIHYLTKANVTLPKRRVKDNHIFFAEATPQFKLSQT
jgi:hypothetical protein